MTLPENEPARSSFPSSWVESLGSGEHPFEVLAIEAGGNQTITEGTFEIP